MFITFEGIDGCGKSSQLELLQEALRRQGQDLLVSREPGGTALAEALRNLILNRETPLHPRAELLLFSAARAQHVDEVIRPALEAGQWVLCDRYIDSTLAYQGGGLGLDAAAIREITHYATAGLMPDLTILLDLSVADGAARLEGTRRDRIEQRDDGFHQRVREAYLALARAEPQRLAVLDGMLPRSQIHEMIVARVRACGSAQPS